MTYDGIEYEDWVAHHRSLDLRMFVFFDPSEAISGATKILKWTRKISKTAEDNSILVEKQKLERQYSFPPGLEEGKVFILKNLGDALDKRVGDLNVITKIR